MEMKKAMVTLDSTAMLAKRIYEGRVGIYMAGETDVDLKNEAERAIKAAETLEAALISSGHMTIEYVA